MYCVNVPRVKGKMAEKGYNLTSMSEELGVARNTFTGYLHNPGTIPYRVLARMAHLLCDNQHEAMDLFFCEETCEKRKLVN